MPRLCALAVIGVCSFYMGRYWLPQYRRNRLFNDSNWIRKYKSTYDRVSELCSEDKSHYGIECHVVTYTNDIVKIDTVLKQHGLCLQRLVDQLGRLRIYTFSVIGSAAAWTSAFLSGSDELYSIISDCKFNSIVSTDEAGRVHGCTSQNNVARPC